VGCLLGDAPGIVLLREQLSRLAALPPWSVLVCGEAGTGKALVARIIHGSTSPEGTFLSAECKTLTPERLEQAWQALLGQGGGTLLLRGIEELSGAPSRLLHQQLQQLRGDGMVSQSVGHSELPGVRVISATRLSFVEVRRRLPAELFQMLSTFIVSIPPLRERALDIAELARTFLEQMSEARGCATVTLQPQASELLMNYEWVDNVRELQKLMELSFDRAEQGVVQASALQAARASQHTHSGSVAPHSIELPKFVRDVGSNHAFDAPGLAEQAVTGHEPWPSAPPSSGTALVGKSGAFTSLPELEEHVITDIFRECNGNLSMAARTLGIPRSTLRDRLKKYGMAPVSVPKKQMG